MIKIRLCSEVLSRTTTISRRTASLRVGVLGVPFYRGQVMLGVETAPLAFREAGLIKDLIKIGNNVRDFGDILCHSFNQRHDVPDKIKSLPDLAACCKNVSEKFVEIMNDERRVLTLGGDHSIALGTVDGHLRAKDGKVCLLWVDAHADMHTADTTESGNIHGMVVGLLAKELTDYWPYLPGLDWQKPQLSLKNIAFIGLRSVDIYERFIIEKHGVPAYGMADIEQYGIHQVTMWALEKINPNNDLSLHLSFDIDCLDALEAPSTGTPVRGGLNLREALHVLETAYKIGNLNGIDLVEVNPKIGNSREVKHTLEAGIHVCKAAFGHCRSGVVPDHIKTLPGFYAPHRT